MLYLVSQSVDKKGFFSNSHNYIDVTNSKFLKGRNFFKKFLCDLYHSILYRYLLNLKGNELSQINNNNKSNLAMDLSFMGNYLGVMPKCK